MGWWERHPSRNLYTSYIYAGTFVLLVFDVGLACALRYDVINTNCAVSCCDFSVGIFFGVFLNPS